MQKIIGLIILLIIQTNIVWSQLSQGGYPLPISTLKSARTSENIVRMPSFDLNQELQNSFENATEKSLCFAHGFEVDLTSKNSGEWIRIDSFKIWRLTIQSDSALSLSLIFKNYRIPEGARLFILGKNETVVLGAFTSQNNKPYKRFAIFPVPGDELTIQYEEPSDAEFEGELEIEKVNHDFIGILKNRWSPRPSGECNIDVNCEINSGLDNEKKSVVRILADNELGTGTLLNNTSNNGKPYLISAFHIYDNEETAQISLFDFNYESPYCTKIDGSDIQSVSGSKAVASFDSLDFMLVELSEIPPASYRPYYSGWSALNVFPSNSYTIHHPNGDVKKISHDEGRCDSLYYSSMFLNYGHWKVLNWESGTTEAGSSGSGLFDGNKRLVGTLSGGYASCTNSTYDAFSRFNKMWDTKAEKGKQLKAWLDTENTGTKVMNGFDPYVLDGNQCVISGNFQFEDNPVALANSQNSDYYTGNNSLGITEIAEVFKDVESGILSGISVGIFKSKFNSVNSEITIRIYSGDDKPKFAEKQFKFPVSSITDKAMNYFSFNEPVSVQGNFFVGIVLPQGIDTLIVYHSPLRSFANLSTLLVKKDSQWQYLGDFLGKETTGSSALIQANVCNASFVQKNDTTHEETDFMKYYPNPATDFLVVELKDRADSFILTLSDMCGNKLFTKNYINSKLAEIDISQLFPGIYILRVDTDAKSQAKKVIVN